MLYANCPCPCCDDCLEFGYDLTGADSFAVIEINHIDRRGDDSRGECAVTDMQMHLLATITIGAEHGCAGPLLG